MLPILYVPLTLKLFGTVILRNRRYTVRRLEES